MDYNVGLWSDHLPALIQHLEGAKEKFLPLKWTSDDNNTYYSIFTNPCGYVVIEFIGDHITDPYLPLFKQFNSSRLSFKNRNNKP